MKLCAAAMVMMMVLAGCSGSGHSGMTDGGGIDGGLADGGGSDGGATPTVCTLAISGPVTTGTYHSCLIKPGPSGGSQLEVAAFSLPGCNGCAAIWTFSQTPTDTCAGGSEPDVQIIDPTEWPDAIGMEATTTNSQASCTITTTELDVAGGHWSGNVDAVVFATDANFMTVGIAHVKLTGGF